MRHGDLREPELARERGERELVLGKPIAVHQHDRDRGDPGVARRTEIAPHRREIERPHDVAARPDALVDLDHALVQQRRQLDPAHEELRPVLIRDAQRVGEAAGDDERRALALALEQRVRGDRRAHLDGVDRARGNRRAGGKPEHLADRVHGGVRVALRILGEQLVRDERAVRTARDDIGERAAAIDPELPACTG